MAKSIEISNFRGFQSVDISDCRRVNVIVGENGSGKTALLEAIFLASGISAELALRTKAWRGYEMGQGHGSRKAIDEALWADLFYDYRLPSVAKIRLFGGPEEHTRALTIQYAGTAESIFPLSATKARERFLESATESSPLSFEWKGPYQKHYKSTASLEEGKLKITGNAQELPIDVVFFAANQSQATLDTVNRFSQLSKSQQLEEVMLSFRTQFDSVESISIEMSAGVPMLFAKVSNRRQKVPLTLLSGGMTKLAAILIAFPLFRRGIVLIDELENGFYYKRLPLIWRALNAFSEAYEAQVFVSTHSQECLRAAAQVARVQPADFSLIRTVRAESGCEVRQFSGTQFADAVESDVEIR